MNFGNIKIYLLIIFVGEKTVKKDRIYIIFRTIINITFACKENYEKKIIRILEGFDSKPEVLISKRICINVENRKISIKENANIIVFENVLETDIYPILYSVIYDLAREEEGVGIHSAAVEKEGKVILIFGDYGIGKSTLALSFAQKGWNIISTDQTVIKRVGNQLQIVKGSKYMKYNESDSFYENDNYLSSTISMLIGVKGLSEKGKVSILKNERCILRVLWEHCIWPWNTLICGYSMINNYKKAKQIELIKKTLNNIEVPLLFVRGDADEVRDNIISIE